MIRHVVFAVIVVTVIGVRLVRKPALVPALDTAASENSPNKEEMEVAA